MSAIRTVFITFSTTTNFRDRTAIIYLRRVSRVRRAVRGGVTKHTGCIVLMPSSRLLAVTLKMTNYRRPPPGLIRSLPEDTRRQTAAFAKTCARTEVFYSSSRGQRSKESSSSSSSSFGVRVSDDGVITDTTVYGCMCRPSRDLFFHNWPRFCNTAMVAIDKLP